MVGDAAAGSVLFHRTQLPESVPGWLLPGGTKTVVSGAGDGNVDGDGIIIMEPSWNLHHDDGGSFN